MQKNFELAFFAGDNSFSGFDRELYKKAFEKAGHTVVFEVRPAERSLRESNAGLLDGDFLRQPNAAKHFPNLIPVNVKLTRIDM